jgi:hypothetical protein
MKTVQMLRDYRYVPHPRRSIHFAAGVTYTRVIDAAARQIEAAGAGRILSPDVASNGYLTRDASHAWRINRRG